MGKSYNQEKALTHQIQRLILENAQLREKEQLYKQGECRLRQQISDDTLLSHIATDLLAATEFNAIERGLKRFIDYLNFSQGFLYLRLSDSNEFCCLAKSGSDNEERVRLDHDIFKRLEQDSVIVEQTRESKDDEKSHSSNKLLIGFLRDRQLTYLLSLQPQDNKYELTQRHRDLSQRFIHQLVNTHLRLQLESDNRTKEETIKRVLEASSDAYFDWNAESGSIEYSDQLWYLLGYKPGEFINTPHNAFHLLHEDDRDRIYNMFKQSLISGQGYITELKGVDKYGNTRWLRARTKVFCKSDDKTSCRMVGSLSDITELKNSILENNRQAVTQAWLLKTVKELFNQSSFLALENILTELQGFLHCDQTGFIAIDENKNTIGFLYKTETNGTLVKPNTYLPLAQVPALDMGDNQQCIINADNHHPIESIIDISNKESTCIVTPLNNKGRLIGYLIAEQHQLRTWLDDELYINQIIADSLAMVWLKQSLRRDLESSEERFNFAMQASADAIGDWNVVADEIYLSPSIFTTLGLQQNHKKTQNIEFVKSFIHPDEREAFIDKYEKWMSSGTDYFALETRLSHSKGHSVWSLLRSKVVERSRRGFPRRIVSVLTDISDFKQVQINLEKSRRSADEANQAKSEFLARMSHEIRTPINAIQGLSHLLLDTQLSGLQEDYLHDINNAASSLLGIINDILDFSKIEAGKLNLDHHKFNLPALAKETIKWLTVNAKHKELPIRLNIDKEIPNWLIGDSSRINQILVNLLGNAIKFTDTGEIVVAINLDKQTEGKVHITFSITDTGIGIDEKLARNLFDPFSQADGSSSRKYGGTGLGLAICHQLANKMGGELTFSSTLGQGSSFSLSLPLEIAEQPETATIDTINAKPLQPLHVLLVEDNIVNQKVAKGMLKKLNATTEIANNGKEALELINSNQKNTFDLILMDIEMPELDGYSTTQRIRQDSVSSQIPIIAMTAHAMSGDREKCLAAGMDDYITKPIDLMALESALRAAIDL